MLTWSADSALRISDLTSREGPSLFGYLGEVYGPLLLAEADALSWSMDGTLRAWDLTRRTSRQLRGHDGWVCPWREHPRQIGRLDSTDAR